MEANNCNLKVSGFASLELTGVYEVTGFDEKQIELSMGNYNLCVGGENLKIESFSRESKTIHINGEIDSVIRESEAHAKPNSFFSRFFS